MTRRATFLAAVSAVVAMSTLCGCGALDNCPDGQKPIEITTGRSDKDAVTYDSAPWNLLDAFPAKTELWFKHDLGVVPETPHIFLSFSAVGTNGVGGGSVAETAGNQALIDCVDAQYIVIRNDTCEPDFHIRVTTQGESLFNDPDREPFDKPDACGDYPPP